MKNSKTRAHEVSVGRLFFFVAREKKILLLPLKNKNSFQFSITMQTADQCIFLRNSFQERKTKNIFHF
jgi:hypothetical protein